MKKYMIRCDMEGVSGIVSYEQAEPGKSEYDEGRRLFFSDLDAMVKGLLDGGADQVHIYDEHYYGRNVDMDRLPENVYVYCGKPLYRPNWAGGLDSSFDGMLLLGLHSKRGTFDALLNHTYEPDIRDIEINGVSVGEIGMEAAIAGELGVPLVMITADSEGIREAKELIPGTCGVSVKESCSEFGALCYPLKTTYQWIYDAAKKVVTDPPAAKPLDFGKDVTVKVHLFDTPYTQKYLEMFGEASFHSDSVLNCWAQYLQNKIDVQKQLTL